VDYRPASPSQQKPINYPKNNGFANTPDDGIIEPGSVIDRFGSERGRYFAPADTPIEMRSLAPTTNTNIYNRYEVLKPLPAKVGITKPHFNQPGGGIQIMTPNQTAQDLMRAGYIQPVKY
jgi:hypothetical protein